MKYVLTNKAEGIFNSENPIEVTDLFEIGGIEVTRNENYFPVSRGDGSVRWEIAPTKRLKEEVIQDKSQLLGTLKSDILYVIDGDIAFNEGEYITVPESGLNIMGYSFDASRLGSYGVQDHKIFRSGSSGSGNLILHNIAFTCTGVGAGVFDIFDSNGSHALEMVTVNFEGCSTLGKITGYRQGTGITIGIYGCDTGLELDGTWNGFKLTNTNSFGFGTDGVMFKAGSTLTFSNRFYLEVNVDFSPEAAITNASPTNFLEDNLLQINTTMAKVNGTIDPVTNTPLLFPNISPNDPEALFTDNIGIVNTKLTPFGMNTSNIKVASDDTDASTKDINVGDVYIESSTGYFKTRLT